jgi:hypothetical protein
MGILEQFFLSRRIKTEDQLFEAVDTCVGKLERLHLQFLDACVDMLDVPDLMEQRSVFVGSDADFALSAEFPLRRALSECE